MKTQVSKEISKYISNFNSMSLNKILWTIKWRDECYGLVWLSRHEHEKFWLSERQCRRYIETFIQQWLLELESRREIDWKSIPCNVYTVTEKLNKILQLLKGWIIDMSEKIKSVCKNMNIENFFTELWIDFNRKTRKLKDNKWRMNSFSNISYSNKCNKITDWKEWETYDIYNFCTKLMWYTQKDTLVLLKVN